MKQYLDKDAVMAEIKGMRDKAFPPNSNWKHGYFKACESILSFLDTLEVKEVDLTDAKTDWSPSKKQMESLNDMLKYNIGVFDYQKFMEVNSLYEDLMKILDYETDRQK